MKNVILFVFCCVSIFSPMTSFAGGFCDTNKISVVYINGMLNSEIDAENGRAALEKKLRLDGVIKLGDRNIIIRKAYNPSHLAGAGDTFKVLVQRSLDQIQNISGIDHDAKQMLIDLHGEVKEGRILFVPHSQGNFYANSLYKWIAAQEDGLSHESMTMYNVASPAQLSASNAKYILSKTDKVIAGLVGSVGQIAKPNENFVLPKNHIDGLGHNFVDTYLALGGERMISDIKSQLKIIKSDESKINNTYCIPSPEEGFLFNVTSLVYKVVDPVAEGVKFALALPIEAAMRGYSSLASVIGHDDKYIQVAQSVPSKIEPTHVSTSADTPANSTNEVNKIFEDYKTKIEPKLAQNNQPVVIKPIVKNNEVSEEILNKYYEQIAYLKKQIEEQKSQIPPQVSSGFYSHSSHTYNEPMGGDGDGILNNNKPTSTSTASSTIGGVSSSTPDTNNNGTPGQGENASSTIPITSNLTLGIDVIGESTIRTVSVSGTLKGPDNGRLMISEYYIGKEGEVSWVEIINTSKNDWVDTSSVIFSENEKRYYFPVTAIKPFGKVVLKSDGNVIHSMTDPDVVVAKILASRIRSSGSFYLMYKDGTEELVLDEAPYGGNYCENKYSYSRSCERMVSLFPGSKEEYWVRSHYLDPNYILSYSNNNNKINPKYWSSVGVDNASFKYDIYEGRKIKGVYENEVIDRGFAGYVSGIINIPANTVKNLYYYESWKLFRTEESIFENINETVVNVFGRLNVRSSAFIERGEGNYLQIYVHYGGKLIRYNGAVIHVPLHINGGVARVNYIVNDFKIESGALFISSFNEGQGALTKEYCDHFRSEYVPFTWISGKIFIEGFDCGTNESSSVVEGDSDYGISKVIDRRSPDSCSYFWNSDGEVECIKEDSNNPPPSSGNNASTTASSTGQIGSVLGSSTSTATSTNNGSNTGNSTSTASTTVQSIIPFGEVRQIDTSGATPITPIGRIMITEYYIGKAGEASWVEIINTSKTDWIDTSRIYFVDNEERVRFPVTSMPPFSAVILRSEGEMMHSLGSKKFPVALALTDNTKADGVFALLHRNNNDYESIIDSAGYGGDYCKNIYSYSRSCERMVTAYLGNNPEYWVRSRKINSTEDPKFWSTIGAYNTSWQYDIYEGRKIKGVYVDEHIKRPDNGYVSGTVVIPANTEVILNASSSWRLINSESYIYNKTNQTSISVFGKLRTLKSSTIEHKEDGGTSIIINDGGLFIKDPYSSITPNIIVNGGVARLNTLTNIIHINDGKLYVTYFDDGAKMLQDKSCGYYRNIGNKVRWNGGNIYIEGNLCGSNDLAIKDEDVKEFDIFGVIDRREPKSCPYHFTDNAEMECDVDALAPLLKVEKKEIEEVKDIKLEEHANKGMTVISTAPLIETIREKQPEVIEKEPNSANASNTPEIVE